MGRMKQELIGILEEVSNLQAEFLDYQQKGIVDEDKLKRLHNRGLLVVNKIHGNKSEEYRQACELDPAEITGAFTPGTDELSRIIADRHRTVIGAEQHVQGE